MRWIVAIYQIIGVKFRDNCGTWHRRCYRVSRFLFCLCVFILWDLNLSINFCCVSQTIQYFRVNDKATLIEFKLKKKLLYLNFPIKDGFLHIHTRKMWIDLYRCQHHIQIWCGIIYNQNHRSTITGWNLYNYHIYRKLKWHAPIRNSLNAHCRISTRRRTIKPIHLFNKSQTNLMLTNMCSVERAIGRGH